jgi:energy-coupling factor transporter ATP-binding protein EcfA2
MYPYGLTRNPYHSSPTPRFSDSAILGGERHKEAKNAILSCMHDVSSKMNLSEKDLRVVTIIQDVGSGKTHLALHMQTVEEMSSKSVISYVDFSQISPRSKTVILSSILDGFREEDLEGLRSTLIGLMMASRHDREKAKLVKKLFKHGLLSEIKGESVEDKIGSLLQKRIQLREEATLNELLGKNFTDLEKKLIYHILNDTMKNWAGSIVSLGEMLELLASIISLNQKLLNKLTIFEFDEFDSEGESMEFIKAIINFVLPSSMILLIMTPASYDEIGKKNLSLYDRLEKANYKIDLAGSNTYSEINDIVLEYMRSGNSNGKFTLEEEHDLSNKIKIIYDEFPDFRNVRSMINILYHATELAGNSDVGSIDEHALDETIRTTFPGLRIKGSIMSVPVSDFMKIRRMSKDIHELEVRVKNAVQDLVQCTEGESSLSLPDLSEGAAELVDVLYRDSQGDKVAVSVALDKEKTSKINQGITKAQFSADVNKVLILSDRPGQFGAHQAVGPQVKNVNMDDSKLIDLIYFSSKYRNSQISDEDLKRASMLARSIELP